jgi:superfamily II DNA or RNA helicase
MNVEFTYDSIARKPKIVSEYLKQIREHFSVEDKALVFMQKRTGRRGMPVRKYAISDKGHFELPFFRTIYTTVVEKFPALQISISENLIPKIQSNFIAAQPVKLNYQHDPRDYQLESATKALSLGSGIIVLPTSAGKTLTIALIVSTILNSKPNSNVLIIVPNIQLVQQTYGDFIEYGIDSDLIARWTGDFEYKHAKIVIANNQILLSKNQDKEVLNSFNVLICDECHKIGSADKITKLLKSLRFEHMFGFTGSMPENIFQVWNINRVFGSVIYHKQSIELRENKFISKVRVVGLEMSYKEIPKFTKPSMADPTAGYVEETEWIHINNFRNNTIAKVADKLDTNTLVLVDRIAHGEVLSDYLKANTTKQVYFIQGSVELEEREQMRKLMEETSGVICIAISNIFSTGISIKNLHNVIFASIGKARIKIIQSIGRSLRLHHTKEIATIFDVADICLNYGFKHYEERKRLYEAENIPLITKQLVEV